MTELEKYFHGDAFVRREWANWLRSFDEGESQIKLVEEDKDVPAIRTAASKLKGQGFQYRVQTKKAEGGTAVCVTRMSSEESSDHSEQGLESIMG